MADKTTKLTALLALLLPLGSAGVSAALADTPGKPAAGAGAHDETADVAGRLQAIRDAVSRVTVDEAGTTDVEARVEKAWWGNWRPGWRNGGGGWRNGGWGWRNGGGWPNWHNGWRNGGWNNFWRNW